MLEAIVGMSNGELYEALKKESKMSPDKIKDLFPIIGVCIVSNMKEDLRNGRLSEISKSISFEKTDYYYEIESKLVSCLNCKLSLPKNKAQALTEIILPYIMKYIKSTTSNNKGDIDELELNNLLVGKEKVVFNLSGINNFIKI